jgi:hypothetical protein
MSDEQLGDGGVLLCYRSSRKGGVTNDSQSLRFVSKHEFRVTPLWRGVLRCAQKFGHNLEKRHRRLNQFYLRSKLEIEDLC